MNFTALSQEEIGKLQKIHVFKTEVVNQTTNYNRTYYINYRQVEVAGPVVYRSGQNLIGLVVFSIAVGFVTAMLGEDGKPLLRFVDAMNKVLSKLVQFAMWYAFIFPVYGLLSTANFACLCFWQGLGRFFAYYSLIYSSSKFYPCTTNSH